MKKEINASIITIGDELLIGQTIDTNSAFIGQELNKLGIWVKRRIAIGDVTKDILDTLKAQSKENDLIIITGGLGPTADDITKPALCEYFGANMIVNEDAEENVKSIFTKVNRPITSVNLKQAEVPDNCMVLQNKRGTAPGMWFEKEGVVYISLPGVPNEMKGLILDSVIEKLKEKFETPFILHKTLLTAGIGESNLAEHIEVIEAQLPAHIKLAYLPSYGMVKLRLTGKGNAEAELTKEMEGYFSDLKNKVSEWLVIDEDKTIEEVIAIILKEKGKFVGSAESCTGGYIAHLLTKNPGSSSIFKGGVVSYANEAKENILKVQPHTLASFGAVSRETVKEMVSGVLALMNVDYAVATSGIMGPDGGSKEKPVGTVWIAVGTKNNIKTLPYFVRFDRPTNIALTARTALNELRKFILEEEKD
ncbi:MAG: CinA family nicotinamide mononucleotide deamidase-related protein [Chitinophagaceae bacterium]